MDGRGAGLQCGPAGWALGSSSPRSIRSKPSRPPWTDSKSSPCGTPSERRTSSSPRPAARTSTAAHFPAMKDGVVLANAGHFDNEISKADLEKTAKGKRRVREFVDEYALPGGKRAYLVAEGR